MCDDVKIPLLNDQLKLKFVCYRVTIWLIVWFILAEGLWVWNPSTSVFLWDCFLAPHYYFKAVKENHNIAVFECQISRSNSDCLLTTASQKSVLCALEPRVHWQCLDSAICLCKEKLSRHTSLFIMVPNRQKQQEWRIESSNKMKRRNEIIKGNSLHALCS